MVKGFMMAKDAVGRFQAENALSTDVLDILQHWKGWRWDDKLEQILEYLEEQHEEKLQRTPNAVTVAELASCPTKAGGELGETVAKKNDYVVFPQSQRGRGVRSYGRPERDADAKLPALP